LPGKSDDVFIRQTSGALRQQAAKQVILSGAVLAKTSSGRSPPGPVNVGAGAHLKVDILVKTVVSFQTGASLNRRLARVLYSCGAHTVASDGTKVSLLD
jgi:hypothetical protein